MMIKNNFLNTLLLLLFTLTLFAQQEVDLGETVIIRKELATGLVIPWEIIWGPDDHIWVTERRGKVLRIEPTSGNTQEILDISDAVENEDHQFGSEYGMLGFTFHPEFETTPIIYLVYNYDFPLKEKLVSFEWNGSELINETIILDDVPGATFHNGSRLLISMDNKILMTTGDARDPNSSQDLNELSGKILRINLDGSIPSDNPMPGSYIYSYGHRNPQGLTYGPNDILYSSEHGELVSDEINIIEPMRNYGWPDVEGPCNSNVEMIFCDQNNVKEPIWEWTPCVGISSLTYYDHDAIPEWKGKMLLTVLGGAGFTRKPRISVLTLNEDGTLITEEEELFKDDGRIRDLCVNPYTGAIYYATNGPFYPGEGPNQIIEYVNRDLVSVESDLVLQNVKLVPNPATDYIELQSSDSLLGSGFEIFSFQGKLVKSGTVSSLTQKIDLNEVGGGNYFIKVSNKNGALTRTFSLIK